MTGPLKIATGKGETKMAAHRVADMTVEELKLLIKDAVREANRESEPESIDQTTRRRPPLNFPVDSVGTWPSDLSLRREDWYDDEF